MATGRVWQAGGVVDPADVQDAGTMEWGRISGIEPHDPLMRGGPTMGGTPLTPNDPDIGRSRIVTLPASERAAGADAEPQVFDDWRDLLDYHSPVFWVFLLTLAAIGLTSLRISAAGRLGPAHAAASAGVG
jgi:hypothetical protein